MGVYIKATGVSANSHDSSIDNAVQAAQQCLDNAGVASGEVDLLINIGVYRDDNIMEPSIAALIQQRLQLNPDPVKGDFDARTFSFDLMNGASGFLNAVDVAGAMLQNGVYRNVLVVSGDVHPSRRKVAGFPFTSIGGAALLGYSADSSKGFSRISARSVTRDAYFGYYSQGALADFGDSGRQHALFLSQPQFEDQFCLHLADTVRRYLQQERISRSMIDVLLTSQIEAGFPARLAQELELDLRTAIGDFHGQFGDPHTSAPIVCLHELLRGGTVKKGHTILFALVGSGISSTCALYRVPA